MATLDDSREENAAEGCGLVDSPQINSPKQSPLHQDISAKNILDLTEIDGDEDGGFYLQPREPPAVISRPPEDDKILKGIVRNEVNDLLQSGTFRCEHHSIGTLSRQQPERTDSQYVASRTATPIRGSIEDQKIDTNQQDTTATINTNTSQQEKANESELPLASTVAELMVPVVDQTIQRFNTNQQDTAQCHPLDPVPHQRNFSNNQQDTLHPHQLTSVPSRGTVEEIIGMIEDQTLQDAILKGSVAATHPHQMNVVPSQSGTVEEIIDMIEHQKHQDAITKGAVAAARNPSNQTSLLRVAGQEAEDQQTQASPVPNDGTPIPTSLCWERRVLPVTQPGAVAISSAHSFAAEQEEAIEGSFSGRDEEGGVLPLPQDYLLDATLVTDQQDNGNGQELVEAEPALEGLEAMANNQHCKLIAACILLFVILVFVVPLVIFLPGLHSDEILLDGVDENLLECGTRNRYQADYRGLTTFTETGIECQDWSTQFPHQHEHTPDAYPDANLVKNYCRNPSGEGQPRAWCYTKDPNHRWGYCDVKFCNEDPYEFREECATTLLGGYDYRGNISVSATGKTCLPWNDTGLPINPENFPNAGLKENYCRNPDSNQPYCFVNDPNNPKEPCDLPRCESLLPGSENICHNCTEGQCGTPRLQMSDYRGTINVTLQGNVCSFWRDFHRLPGEVEEFNLEENYCRNPIPYKSDRATWCYTAQHDSPKEYCGGVPTCEDDFVPRRFCGSDSTQQDDYRGDIKVTISGKQCRPWTNEDAVLERNNPHDKPWDGLVGSYCRNLKDLSKVKLAGAQSATKAGAWCYVHYNAEANEQNWEYCDVPSCKDCGTKSLAKEDYTGKVAKARSGNTCLPWEGREHLLVQENSTLYMEQEVEGESVLYQFGIREKYSLEDKYCRNPLPYQRDTVFCFVDEDGGWEYCDVPDCEEPGMVTYTDCGSQAERQADYRGDMNITVSGRPCRPWELQEEYTAELYADAGLDGSYCRQPAGSARLAAWCFVNETEMKWEYCDVPVCEDR